MKPSMGVPSVAIFIILDLLAITTIINISFCNGTTSAGCIESERQSLLSFKQNVTYDPSYRLASWIPDGDCCTWAGIVCDHLTGHVLELHLQNPFQPDPFAIDKTVISIDKTVISGTISSSLLDLKQLEYLNLSGNSFIGIQIPTFLGSMSSLRYLDLSRNGLGGMIGMIPHQLGNLSNLEYLDLSRNGLVGMIPHQLGNLSNLEYLDLNHQLGQLLYVESFHWLSNLSLLKHLDLSYMNLRKNSDLLSVTNSLPSLKFLGLSSCELHHLPSLPFVNFSSLTALDLKENSFGSSSIPRWIFGLRHLDYLDISSNSFVGQIPEGLQNLTSLRQLDLSNNNLNSMPNWLYRLSHLEYFSIASNRFKGTISPNLGNLTSILSLDLSRNEFVGKIARSFGKLCHLRRIDLYENGLSQGINEIIDIFSTCAANRLDTIDMGNNKLFGQLTHAIGEFKRLKSLSLGGNSISGPIPSSLGELSSLRLLDLSRNRFNETLFEVHFLSLTRLTDIDVSGNSLSLKVHPNWIPPFQLKGLNLSYCDIGPEFPKWLRSQRNLSYLDLSNCQISSTIPDWLWNSPLQLQFIDLSNNQINGEIPNLNDTPRLESLFLSSNNLSGPLPLISSNLLNFDASNNSLSGPVTDFLRSTGNESSLHKLILKNNSLLGEIPDCWMNFSKLKVLNLAGNNLSGKLPVSVGSLEYLGALYVQQNNLSGTIPVSLQNCSSLEILDISENKFAGNVPTWIGEKLTGILILNLRSNNLNGSFPKELCRLEFLQVLDLSHNNLSGRLPSCIGNFSAMETTYNGENAAVVEGETPIFLGDYYLDKVSYASESFVMKGKKYEYDRTLNLVRKLDVSKNNFTGEIPTEVTHLGALVSLNLSYNFLNGKIPKNIGDMGFIEEIDFSHNQLSGEIPPSVSKLTFLNRLNLSNNNLTGKIPSSTQLQSLDPSNFNGNELCGAPLHSCTETTPAPEAENREGKNNEEMLWFYVSMVFGFVVGFWGFVVPLFVNRRWRHMYYNFLDYLGYKFRDVVRKCW